MKYRVHMLTEGAMMVALIGIFLFVNQQLAGILEYMIHWVLSFPILLYTIRYGMKQALIVSISMMLLSFIIATPTAVFYLGQALLCGMVYGGGVRNKWSNKLLLSTTGILTLVSYIITTIIFANVFGYDPMADIKLANMLAETFSLQHIAIGQIVLAVSLGTVILIAFLQTISIHMLAILLMRRMRIEVNPTKTIFDLHLPKGIAYISICILVLFYLRNMIKLEGNLLLVIVSGYVIISVIMCVEVMLSLLCMSVLLKKRIFMLIGMFLCLGMLALETTRMILIILGIYSCLTQIRSNWKRGAIYGTIRKS